MRRYVDQIRFSLQLVRELAARDGKLELVRMVETALFENETGKDKAGPTIIEKVQSNQLRPH